MDEWNKELLLVLAWGGCLIVILTALIQTWVLANLVGRLERLYRQAFTSFQEHPNTTPDTRLPSERNSER